MKPSSRNSKTPLLRLLMASAIAIVVACSAGLVASAGATSSIEGVWSFNGGQIAVQPSGSTFTGTVVAETKFASCTHPVGQQIWTKMSPQADGSLWGFHQWYYESSACVLNPVLGPTAWRVLTASDGSRFLRACFSSPGGPQPTIGTDGSHTNVSYGCVDSALTAPLPAASGAASFKLLKTPSTKQCLSLRRFQIHLKDPSNDPFKKVIITIRGHSLALSHSKGVTVATVNLKGLPRGTFSVVIHATTVLGHHLDGKRTYHTCVRKVKAPTKHKKKH